MKKLFLGLLALSTFIEVSAQNIQGDFEEWDEDGLFKSPKGWVSTISGFCNDSFTPIEKSSETNTGEWSAFLKVNTCLDPIEAGSIGSVLYTGTLEGGAPSVEVWSIPYTYRPDNFNFYYKFQSTEGDAFKVEVMFFTYDEITEEVSQTIVHHTIEIDEQTSEFTLFQLPIEYDLSNTPEYLSIKFFSSTELSSQLWIDDVDFTGGNIGIDEETIMSGVTISPNPAQYSFKINFDESLELDEVLLVNLLGSKVKSIPLDVTEHTLKGLSAGVYYLKVRANGKLISKKIIVL